MLEKEKIQSKLEARQKLASLSVEELIALARNPEEFDKFIKGYAASINYFNVCYDYRYDGIIRSMINENMDRLSENEELANNVYHVLKYFDRHSKESYGTRIDFYNQFQAIEESNLGLSRFGLSLEEFDKCAVDYFKKMIDDKFDEIKNDPMYLATLNYMANHHSKYITFSYMIPTIQETLAHVDKTAFADKNEYRKFRRAAKKTMNNLTKAGRKVRKERDKVKLLEK